MRVANFKGPRLAVLWIALVTVPLAALAKKARARPLAPDSRSTCSRGEWNEPASYLAPALALCTLRTDALADASFETCAPARFFDLITIVVLDNSSAVSTGVTNTARKSSVSAAITSLAGPKKATGALLLVSPTPTTIHNYKAKAPPAAPPSMVQGMPLKSKTPNS